MSFQKLKSVGYCVDGRHRSATSKIYDYITSKVSKVLIGWRSICKRTKSMTVSDITIQAEGLGSFFKNLGKLSAKASKKIATTVLKNQVELWKLLQRFQQQPQVKAQKQLYHQYGR